MNRTTYKFVIFTDIYRIDLDLPLDFKSEPDFTVNSRDGVEVCEGPGILHHSEICRSADGKNKIGDAMRNQNTALEASRLFDDPVSWSVCCSLCAAVFPVHRT